MRRLTWTFCFSISSCSRLRSLTSLQASSIFSTAISRLTRSGWSSGVNFKISWKTFYWKYRFFVFGYFVCLSFSNKSPVSALKFPKKKTFIEKIGFCQFRVCFCFPLFIYHEALKVMCQLKNYLRAKLCVLIENIGWVKKD